MPTPGGWNGARAIPVMLALAVPVSAKQLNV